MLPDISREFLNRLMAGKPITGVEVSVADAQFQYRFG
jgi:type VI secretion system protein VasG